MKQMKTRIWAEVQTCGKTLESMTSTSVLLLSALSCGYQSEFYNVCVCNQVTNTTRRCHTEPPSTTYVREIPMQVSSCHMKRNLSFECVATGSKPMQFSVSPHWQNPWSSPVISVPAGPWSFPLTSLGSMCLMDFSLSVVLRDMKSVR